AFMLLLLCRALLVLFSFPTRRSSDLGPADDGATPAQAPVRSEICTLESGSKADRDNAAIDRSECHPTTSVPDTGRIASTVPITRSEEHTSELQSRFDLVCRLLLATNN